MISAWCQQTLLFRWIDVMIVRSAPPAGLLHFVFDEESNNSIHRSARPVAPRHAVNSVFIHVCSNEAFIAAVTCPTPLHFYPPPGEPVGFTSRDLKVLYRLAANLTVGLVDNR